MTRGDSGLTRALVLPLVEELLVLIEDPVAEEVLES